MCSPSATTQTVLGPLNRRKSGCLTCTVLPLSIITSNGRKGACSRASSIVMAFTLITPALESLAEQNGFSMRNSRFFGSCNYRLWTSPSEPRADSEQQEIASAHDLKHSDQAAMKSNQGENVA